MKYWIGIFALSLLACNNRQDKVDVADKSNKTDGQAKKETCWKGKLNDKIPVFIHYQIDGELVIGEITYLNTKAKEPIKLLGTIEGDTAYRLLEFDPTGNITGIIEGVPFKNHFDGIWFSPKTRKELGMKLTAMDTSIASPEIKTDREEYFGNYHYQYGEEGYRGDFDVNRVDNVRIDFSITSLTEMDQGPNVAEVEKDTISLQGNSFIYKLPGSDSCEFKTIFYKDFVFIKYTKGYCEGQFGWNASIDGIFLKEK